ncbi:acyltransferase family protein [Edaphobacter bradus]|uniref:acyltransferase family protein n=1 Tax=Edaphobacter bradus TaxID=2259016 RepID=UPI0021DFA6F4|nr:acyltransferase [Edaphobacter bradus]
MWLLPSSPNTGNNRIDRLDGLRTVAILMVVCFHTTRLGPPFGYSGVDLFFVLSGYFITGILLGTRSKPNYWSRFYIRRIARILPPVILLLALYVLVTKHVQPLTVLGYGLFAGNLTSLTRFSRAMLNPLWSLAVEEHFYLLWPLAVAFFRRRTLLMLLLAILVTEPILRAMATPHFDSWAYIYYLTPFRLDSLAAGSLLALLTEAGAAFPWQRWCGWAVLALSPSFLFCSTTVRDVNSVTYNALAYSFFAAIYFCLVAWVLMLRRGVVYDILSSRPVTYLGRISYGVYLFHIPVNQVMLRALHRDPSPVDLILTLGLASVIYFVMERPIIAYARRLTNDVQKSFAESFS